MQFWKLNAYKSYWILSSFSSPLLLLSSPLLAPPGTNTSCPRTGCTSPPRAQVLHLVLLVQWKEQTNWISTRRKKPAVSARALRCLLAGADKHIPFFHIIREKMCVAACMQESSLCEFVVNFRLEGNENNSFQTSPEKRLSSWYGQYLSKETNPYCCYIFILM